MMSWILTVVYITGIMYMMETGHNALQLTSNGYEDLVVSVNKKCDGEFSQSEATDLLDNLQNIITEGSSRLHYATDHRILIWKVIVLLPKGFPAVQGRTYLTDSSASYSSANIVVDTLNPLMGHSPYTIQPRGCGEEGDYIHYTHEYMIGSINRNYYGGNPGKKFAREFSKLRWGLFNESSNSNDKLPGNPYYKDSANNIQAVRCPFALQGELVQENGKQCTYLDDCVRFSPHLYQDTPADYASILSHHQHDSVVKFCSDDPSDPETFHNSDAGNQHNDLCGARSAWEVMNQHGDFSVNRSYQLQEPIFEYYGPSRRTIVLVLDVSGSMSDSKDDLHQAASLFIENTRYNCHKVGIVKFNSDATIVQNIISVDSRQDKESLLDQVPRESDGGTCIGCGILRAIQMLQDEGITEGGNLIVLTDGDENDAAVQHISTIGAQVHAQGVTIDGILYGGDVDITHPLHTLVVDTGGKPILANNDDSLKFNADFIELAAERACAADGHVDIVSSTTQHVAQGQSRRSVFYIDISISETIQFVITPKIDYHTLRGVVVEVHTPDGVVSRSDTDAQWIIAADQTSMKWRTQVNDQTGMWSYRITNNNPTTTDFYVIVTGAGETVSCDTVPVLIKPYFLSTIDLEEVNGNDPRMKIAAHAVRGRTSLLDATVVARVTPTGGSQVEVVLKDDGQDPDLVPDDGVYTALFNGITQDGTYDVELSLEQISSKRRKRSRTMRSMLSDNITDFGAVKRVQQSGFFEVRNALSSGFLSKQDPYAPSRVTNLIATDNTLEFTAVGDDYNTGAADGYVVKVSSTNARDLIGNFDDQQTVIEMGMVEPYTIHAEAGEHVVLDLTIPEHLSGIPFFYAVVAYDDAGNRSPISNIAQLGVNTKSAVRTRIVEASAVQVSSDMATTFNNSCYSVCIFGLTVLFMIV